MQTKSFQCAGVLVHVNRLITASIWRGMEVISLWHCWGGMEAQVSLTVAFSSDQEWINKRNTTTVDKFLDTSVCGGS